MEAVDLVYLWVDGNDPKWLEKRNSFLDKSIKKASITGRYENNDELKYSLRSVEKYLPWVRKIFIVTDNQIPNFINPNHPKITLINHSDIIPKEYLPTFNSVVIEYFLHNIPDLSEKFLLASDDCFVNTNLAPDFFFKEDLPIIRMMYTPLQRIEFTIKKLLNININSYRLSIENAYKLISKKYNKHFTSSSHHNIDAYLKSDYKKTATEIFKNELEGVCLNRFRNKSDIQRILFSYDALSRKRGHLKYVNRRESCRIRVHRGNFNKYLTRYNPKLFCLNDTDHASDEHRKQIKPFLESLFPAKSEFEK
ncbi:MAG: Stealth CR1 domain-containing protein [Flavobacteriaceae bacterium]|nr:Stealth CR1 domain-containing protein [Flavobacteriaceae bacterium]